MDGTPGWLSASRRLASAVAAAGYVGAVRLLGFAVAFLLPAAR